MLYFVEQKIFLYKLKQQKKVKLEIEALIWLEFEKCWKLELEFMKMQARASARAPARAKIQFSNVYTYYASKQKNHHERSPKHTIEACLIQTFSQNDIFCKSDLTICFFFFLIRSIFIHAHKKRNERRAQFCRHEFNAKNPEIFCNEFTNTCSFAQKKVSWELGYLIFL